MFNKLFVFSLLIGAVTAQLEDGLYRILNPKINSLGYVAKSGYEIGTPVTLSLSQPMDLHELWVVRRIPQSPPNYYTLLNIGQDQPVYATDYDVAFQDQNQIQDVEKFVFTGTNQRSYYIASPNNDENYVIYTGPDRSQAWTADSQTSHPISIKDVGAGGQNWKFVSVLKE